MYYGQGPYIFRSPWIFLLWALLVPVAHLQTTRVEEPLLKRRYGNEYVRYRAEVPRWTPRVK